MFCFEYCLNQSSRDKVEFPTRKSFSMHYWYCTNDMKIKKKKQLHFDQQSTSFLSYLVAVLDFRCEASSRKLGFNPFKRDVL